MKKILTSLVMVLMVAAVATGATLSQFSDTETSTGNTFGAGTLDLKVDNQDDPMVVHVTKTDMKPQTPYSYQGYNNQWILKNAGSLPGTVSITIKNLKNYENGCNEPETSLGDGSCTVDPDQGELGQYTWVKWSENHWGIYDPSLGWPGSAMFNPLNTANGVVVAGPTLTPGQLFSAYMWLDFPKRADDMENLAQSDSMEFDIEFKLVQIP